jgi:hypothetical protein
LNGLKNREIRFTIKIGFSLIINEPKQVLK